MDVMNIGQVHMVVFLHASGMFHVTNSQSYLGDPHYCV